MHINAFQRYILSGRIWANVKKELRTASPALRKLILDIENRLQKCEILCETDNPRQQNMAKRTFWHGELQFAFWRNTFRFLAKYNSSFGELKLSYGEIQFGFCRNVIRFLAKYNSLFGEIQFASWRNTIRFLAKYNSLFGKRLIRLLAKYNSPFTERQFAF